MVSGAIILSCMFGIVLGIFLGVLLNDHYCKPKRDSRGRFRKG